MKKQHLQPYGRVPQANAKISGADENSEAAIAQFYDRQNPKCRFIRHAEKFRIGKKEKKSSESFNVLRGGQLRRFKKLLQTAYGIDKKGLVAAVRRTSYFIKKKFESSPDAFFITTVARSSGEEHVGLFVRHTNPDKSPGGIYEATVHIHSEESKLVIDPGCIITGNLVLIGNIELKQNSRIETGGVYQDVAVTEESRLISCHAHNSRFESSSYAYKSVFKRDENGPADPLSFSNAVFKKCSLVSESMSGVKVENGKITGPCMPKIVPEHETEQEAAAEEPGSRGKSAYAVPYVLGWLYAFSKDIAKNLFKQSEPVKMPKIGGHC